MRIAAGRGVYARATPPSRCARCTDPRCARRPGRRRAQVRLERALRRIQDLRVAAVVAPRRSRPPPSPPRRRPRSGSRPACTPAARSRPPTAAPASRNSIVPVVVRQRRAVAPELQQRRHRSRGAARRRGDDAAAGRVFLGHGRRVDAAALRRACRRRRAHARRARAGACAQRPPGSTPFVASPRSHRGAHRLRDAQQAARALRRG